VCVRVRARFEVLTAVLLIIQVVWHMAPGGVLHSYQHFGWHCCSLSEGRQLFANPWRHIPEDLNLPETKSW